MPLSPTDLSSAFAPFKTTKVAALKPEQIAVIRRVMRSEHVLALFPTGAGKSLCYQVAGRARGGLTVVVSPLIALMEEQSQRLRDLGIEAQALHSDVKPDSQMKLLTALAAGTSTLAYLFLSPERLAMNVLVQQALRRCADRIALVAIDEAHCISEWGNDFRPLYTLIPRTLDAIFGARSQWPPILAMTATLGALDVEEIRREFAITHCERHPELTRKGIELVVRRFANETDKHAALWACLEEVSDGLVLAFQYKIKGANGVEELAEQARQRGLKAAAFHSRMTSAAKQTTVEHFRSGQVRVLFATSAFGMGMDVENIRTIIHVRPPPSIEEYYQQIGRAGRDGKPSRAISLYTGMNEKVRKLFLNSLPADERIAEVFHDVVGSQGKPGFKSQNPWDEEDSTLSCLRYLESVGALHLVGPGITSLKGIQGRTPSAKARLKVIHDASPTGDLVIHAKRLAFDPVLLAREIADLLLDGSATSDLTIKQVMVIEIPEAALTQERLKQACDMRDRVRQAKEQDLDHLATVFDEYSTSKELHDAIAEYLGYAVGIRKPQFDTSAGFKVRSKNEVIITNALHDVLGFEYEKDISLGGKTWSPGPDFLVRLNDGTEIIWEHLGMLQRQNYLQRWEEKRNVYEKYRPGQVLVTHDEHTLGGFVQQVISWLVASDRRFVQAGFDWQMGIGQLVDPVQRERVLSLAAHHPNPGKPVAMHALTNAANEVLCEAELAYPNCQPPIAFVSDAESETAFNDSGWKSYRLDQTA